MAHKDLRSFIAGLERGTNLHITVEFLDNFGNAMTRCSHSQRIHDRPICLCAKKLPGGVASCYRCRMTVQKRIIATGKPMRGYCTKGVWEYCHPVMWEDRAVAVVYVGNLLTGDPQQRQRLLEYADPSLLETMEAQITPAECVETAQLVESYIHFLLERYGYAESKEVDALVHNIKSFIRENMACELTGEELAELFGYNKKYLGREFLLRSGTTIHQYCNGIRVGKAKELLSQMNLSIAQIAQQVGFGSPTYFDRVFFEKTKLSPGQYRAATKTKPPK